MMKLKEAISQYGFLNQIVGMMDFCTPMGRMELLNRAMETTAEGTERLLKPIDNLSLILSGESASKNSLLCAFLSQIRDIRHTLDRLHSKQIPDEIELFEIKSFAIVAEKIKEQTTGWPENLFTAPSLNRVTDILDPDRQRVASFYIYDSYSEKLAEIRATVAKLQQHDTQNSNQHLIDNLRNEARNIEKGILKELSGKLSAFSEDLNSAFKAITELDILLSQLRLNRKLNLSRPEIAYSDLTLKGLVHPVVKLNLLESGTEYQPVDIELKKETTLLTGANMSGKSILLQAIALSQLMFQFGFWVAAERASLTPTDEIILIQGDLQNQQQGLSSFAAEVLQISSVIGKIKSGKSMLVLIDEPARTTNPTEGEALVEALVEVLKNSNSTAFITTHYDIKNSHCRKLRTKGIKETDYQYINISHLNRYIDYGLTEADNHSAPREALKVASLMGADSEWINTASEFLKNNRDIK